MIPSTLFNLWIIPGLLLILFWTCLGIYRAFWGSEKNSSLEDKIMIILPTIWCVLFAAIPVFNIILLVDSIRTLFKSEEREKFL